LSVIWGISRFSQRFSWGQLAALWPLAAAAAAAGPCGKRRRSSFVRGRLPASTSGPSERCSRLRLDCFHMQTCAGRSGSPPPARQPIAAAAAAAAAAQPVTQQIRENADDKQVEAPAA